VAPGSNRAFYPTSTYAKSLSDDIVERAKHRLFLPPPCWRICDLPPLRRHNASSVMDELLPFFCQRCGTGVKVEPPRVQ
jgi:hypothetical protein